MAGDEAIDDGAELGFLHPTTRDGHRASLVERAACCRDLVRCIAEVEGLVTGGIARLLQGARVQMLGLGIEVCRGRELSDFARIHDGNARSYVTHRREIVRNEQRGEADFGLKPFD